jgi:hypothetical protein
MIRTQNFPLTLPSEMTNIQQKYEMYLLSYSAVIWLYDELCHQMCNKQPHLKQMNFDDIEVRKTQMLQFGYV